MNTASFRDFGAARNSLLAVILASAAVGVHANLLINGSFEISSVVDSSIGPGATAIEGWSVGGTDVTVQNSFFGVLAEDGANYLDLTGACDLRCNPLGGYGSVAQTIATTVGTSYELSFYGGSYAANVAAPTLVASAGSATNSYVLPVSTASIGDWTHYSFEFTANAATTAISFAGSGGQIGDTLLGVDNVQVTAVPEPATYLLMLVGLCVGGVAMRRRNRHPNRYLTERCAPGSAELSSAGL